MKPLQLFLLLCFFAFVSCDKNGPCDDTTKPEINVTLNATVHVLDKHGNPIPNQDLHFWIYKIPCGAKAKGEFTFHGKTDVNGTRSSTTVGYKLRNLDDEVWIDVHAVNLGNGSADADSEYVILKYSDFLGSLTAKQVHVYIYKK